MSQRLFGLFGVGDIVFDPAHTAQTVATKVQNAAHYAAEIKKYSQMIETAGQQLGVLEETRNVLNQIDDIQYRIWKSNGNVADMGLDYLLEYLDMNSMLGNTGYGRRPDQIYQDIRNGDLSSIIDIFNQTGIYDIHVPGGSVWSSNPNQVGSDGYWNNPTFLTAEKTAYTKYAVVEEQYQNYEEVIKEKTEEIDKVQAQIEECIQKLKNPKNEAEFKKYMALKETYEKQLDVLMNARDQAYQMLEATKTRNENHNDMVKEQSDMIFKGSVVEANKKMPDIIRGLSRGL